MIDRRRLALHAKPGSSAGKRRRILRETAETLAIETPSLRDSRPIIIAAAARTLDVAYRLGWRPTISARLIEEWGVALDNPGTDTATVMPSLSQKQAEAMIRRGWYDPTCNPRVVHRAVDRWRPVS